MRHVIALAMVAACGGVSPPSPSPPPPAAPPALPVPLPPTPRVVDDQPSRPVIEAPPQGAIVALAITPDGASAVTIDDAGGGRLWPTLDGTVEPRVIDLPRSQSLAIAARNAGFEIAAIDEVGGLYVGHVDGDGRTRSHVMLPIEPAVTGIAMTARGVVAWRADQTVAMIGDDGATLSVLGTDPGERIDRIAVSKSHAVALIDTGDADQPSKRARSLTLEPKLAWGNWIDTGDKLVDIAISPSGARVAAVRNAPTKKLLVAVVEVATGKLLASEDAAVLGGLGFFDEDHVATGDAGAISWIDVALQKKQSVPVIGHGALRPGVLFSVAEGRVVTSSRGELVIATPTTVQFLGYDFPAPRMVRDAGGGHLLIGLNDHYALLDRELRVAGEPKIGLPANSSVGDLCRLEGDSWLAMAVLPGDGGASGAVLLDIARGTMKVVARGKGMSVYPIYEPSTHLVTFSLDRPEVDRFDPEHWELHRLGAMGSTAANPPERMIPVAPALADGAQLVHVTSGTKTMVEWLRDPTTRTTAAPSAAIDGLFISADRTGRVLLWQNHAPAPAKLASYAHGVQIAEWPRNGNERPWPSPDGMRVASVLHAEVVLYDAAGKDLWHLPLVGATEALWQSDGGLAVVSQSGLARVDPATGAVTAARCGWKFGLSNAPHPPTSRGEPVCAQLDR